MIIVVAVSIFIGAGSKSYIFQTRNKIKRRKNEIDKLENDLETLKKKSADTTAAVDARAAKVKIIKDRQKVIREELITEKEGMTDEELASDIGNLISRL